MCTVIRLCGIQYTFGAVVFYRERPVFLPKVQCFQYCVLLQCVFCELLGWYQENFALLYRIRIRSIARLVLDNF